MPIENIGSDVYQPSVRAIGRFESFSIGSVVITYNSRLYIENCLNSLLLAGSNVVVVDNGSSDGTPDLVKDKFPSVTVIENQVNLGYSAAVNLGAAVIKSDIFVVCNADVVYPNESIRQLTMFMSEHPDVGAAGPQLIFPDGTWQMSYGHTPGIGETLQRVIGLTSLHHWVRRLCWPRRLDRRPKEVGCVIGAVMAIRRRAFLSLNGWDEDFHFYAEDTDFCMRLRKTGWRVMFVPSIDVVHVGGASSTRVDTSTLYFRKLVESQLLLLKKSLPRWQMLLCAWLERFNCFQMLMAWKLAFCIGPKAMRGYAAARTVAFRHLLKIWAEQSK